MHPPVDCQRAVGASEGGPDGHVEEAIDTKGWRQNDAESTVGPAIDRIGRAPEDVPSDAWAAAGAGRDDGRDDSRPGR